MSFINIEKVKKETKKKNDVYKSIKEFTSKYPLGVNWRLKKHADVIQIHLNPGEKIVYAFPAQKNDSFIDFFSTCIVALTNKRILIAQSRVIYGYSLSSITPDLFNDLSIFRGLVWGRVTIDTVKELVILSNIDKRALPEIETNVSEYMIKEKQKYAKREKKQTD